jgi:hypothetical protein
MSDPREFDRDPNLPRNDHVGRQSRDNSAWIVGGAIAIVLLGLAAYSYRSTEMTSSTAPVTTSGQSTRAPVPTTPLTAPVAPVPRPQTSPAPVAPQPQ